MPTASRHSTRWPTPCAALLVLAILGTGFEMFAHGHFPEPTGLDEAGAQPGRESGSGNPCSLCRLTHLASSSPVVILRSWEPVVSISAPVVVEPPRPVAEPETPRSPRAPPRSASC